VLRCRLSEKQSFDSVAAVNSLRTTGAKRVDGRK